MTCWKDENKQKKRPGLAQFLKRKQSQQKFIENSSQDWSTTYTLVDQWTKIDKVSGSSCGSVGRAVASDTRGPWFVSSHRQTFYIEHLFIVKYIEKTKIKEKGPGMAHFWKKWLIK